MATKTKSKKKKTAVKKLTAKKKTVAPKRAKKKSAKPSGKKTGTAAVKKTAKSKARKKSAKKSAKKAVRKAVKKTVKKAVKKAVKKSVRKAVAQPAKKPAKKTVAPAKKPVKKTTKKAKTPPRKSKPGKTSSRKKSLNPSLAKIRDQLIHKRQEIFKILQMSREVELNPSELNFSNEIDLAASLESREMAFTLSSRDRNELKLIEAALFKIAQGSYGVCESCSKDISIKRLGIMPLTPFCIECQSTMERP